MKFESLIQDSVDVIAWVNFIFIFFAFFYILVIRIFA